MVQFVCPSIRSSVDIAKLQTGKTEINKEKKNENSKLAIIAGLILGLRPANERRRYFVMLSLAGRKPRIRTVF